jgi:hypothetical protein
MARTTLPKEDKAATSSAKAPMAHTLVAQSESKMLDDATIDDGSELLNFVATVSWIGCRMSLLS